VSRSISGLWAKINSRESEHLFVLAKISDLARVNLHRFTSTTLASISWDLVVASLLKILRDQSSSPRVRLQSASIIDLIAMETVKLLGHDNESLEENEEICCRCLRALLDQMESLPTTPN